MIEALIIFIILFIIYKTWNANLEVKSYESYINSQFEADREFDQMRQNMADTNYILAAKRQGLEWYQEWVEGELNPIVFGDFVWNSGSIRLTNPSHAMRDIYAGAVYKEIDFNKIAHEECERLKQEYSKHKLPV